MFAHIAEVAAHQVETIESGRNVALGFFRRALAAMHIRIFRLTCAHARVHTHTHSPNTRNKTEQANVYYLSKKINNNFWIRILFVISLSRSLFC